MTTLKMMTVACASRPRLAYLGKLEPLEGATPQLAAVGERLLALAIFTRDVGPCGISKPVSLAFLE